MPAVTDWLLVMYGILLQHLFLCYNDCVQSIIGFFRWLAVGSVILLLRVIFTACCYAFLCPSVCLSKVGVLLKRLTPHDSPWTLTLRMSVRSVCVCVCACVRACVRACMRACVCNKIMKYTSLVLCTITVENWNKQLACSESYYK